MMKNLRVFAVVTFLCFTGFLVSGQPTQVGNSNFESWEPSSPEIHEPVNWNSFKTASGGLSGFSAQQMNWTSSIRPGSAGTKSVKIWARSVLGTIANGNLTSGRINMGSMTPSDSNGNYNYTQRSNTAFSEPISCRPDSLVVWVKTHIANPGTHLPRIQAVIHDDFDLRTPFSGGSFPHVVGQAVLNYTSTGGTWVRKSLPFSYAYPASVPFYIIVNFTTCRTPGTGTVDDSVIVDDMQLIYVPPLATVSNAPGCGTGSVTVYSTKAWDQTYELCDNGGGVLQTWTGTGTSHTFIGLANGTYRGRVTYCTMVSTLSAATNLTNNPIPTVSASASPSTICNGQSSQLTGSGATTYFWNPGGISGSPVNVSPGSTTTYTVTGTSAGCTNSATVTVTVNPVPTVTASALPATICAGQISQLTGGGAASYVWNPGGISGSPVNVSPGSTTTYTVTGTTAGCTNTASATVTVNPVPTVTASASPATICSGQSSSLTGGGAASYVWNPGGLSGSPVLVLPVSTTTYTVTGTTAGCTNTATTTVTVNPTPVATVSNTPGCGTGTVTVNSDQSGNQTFELCDNAGVTLQSWTGIATSHAFTGLADGTYKGKVTLGSCISALSAGTILTNNLLPIATVASTAGCGSGTVTVFSDQSGNQTFDLCDNAGVVLQSWTGIASSHAFTGLSNGTYKGKVTFGPCVSVLSTFTSLINNILPVATISNTPGCGTGSVTLTSDQSGVQTFELCDNVGVTLQIWTGSASAHIFTGLANGTYTGKITLGSCVSVLSSETILTNNILPVATVSNTPDCGTGSVTVISDQSSNQTFELCDNAGLMLQSWTGVASSHLFSGLANGVYKGKVTLGSCISALSSGTTLTNNVIPVATVSDTPGCGSGTVTVSSDQSGSQTFELCDNAGITIQTWIGAGTSHDFTGLANGVYKGKVTLGTCVSVLSSGTTLTNSILPVATVSNTPGCGTGTITVNSDQSGSQTFELCDGGGITLQTWIGSATSHDFTGLTDGTYTGKVTLGSCTSLLSPSTLLTNNIIPVATISSIPDCGTGSVTVISDQSGSQTFELCDNVGVMLQTWTGVASSHVFTGLANGTYTGKVTLGSCTSVLSSSTTLTNNIIPVATVSNTPGCGTGTVTVTSDQSGSQTFELCDNAGVMLQTWAGTASSHDFTGLADGTYTGKVTLGTCVSALSSSTALINNILPLATISSTPGCGSGTITVTSDQGGTQTFELCDNGGATLQIWTGSATSHDFTGLANGDYTGKVTLGSCTSVLSGIQNLTNTPGPVATVSNTPDCATGSVTVTSDLSGLQTFDLCDNGGSVLQTWAGTATSHEFTGLINGTYRGKVTLGACVSVLSSSTVLTNLIVPVASVSNTPGCGPSGGSVTVTSDQSGTQTFELCDGGGSTLQNWIGAGTSHTFTGLTDGTYTGKVTLGTCLSALSSGTTLTNYIVPVATVSNTPDCGSGTVTVTSDQSGNQTFNLCDGGGIILQTWVGIASSHDFTGLGNGAYTGTVILGSCTSALSSSTTLTNAPGPVATVSSTPDCGTGTVTITSDQAGLQTFDLCDNGGVVLQTWTGSAISHDFTGLADGTYKGKVTLGSCSSPVSAATLLTNNVIPVATVSETPGCGPTSGIITLTSDQGGNQTFELCDGGGSVLQTWTGVATSHDFTGLSDGTYTGKVTLGSCISILSSSTTLTNGVVPVATVSQSPDCGTGTVTVTSDQGGNQIFELCDGGGSLLQSWTGTATSHDFSGLTNGTYTGRVTLGLCVSALSSGTSLTNNLIPLASITDAPDCGSGTITVISDQSGNQTFELCDGGGSVLQTWTGVATSHDFTGLLNGTYTGKVTLGICISILSSAITLTNDVVPVATVSQSPDCGTGTVTVTSDQGGNQIFELCDGGGSVLQSWTGTGTSHDFTGIADGIYTGRVTMGTCASILSSSTTLTNNTIPIAGVIDIPDCGVGTVTVSSDQNANQIFDLCDAGGVVLQTWTGTVTSHDFTGLADGTYTGKVSLGSCESALSSSVVLTNNIVPVATVNSTSGCGTGSVTVTSDQGGNQTFDLCDGVGTVLQSWTGTATFYEFTGLSDGNYTGQITIGSCESSISSVTTLSNDPVTLINADPADDTVCVGGTATLLITASGTGIAYQWRKNGFDLPGEINDYLVISPVALADAGTYTCYVTGSCGDIESGIAILTVFEIPAQPGTISGDTLPCVGSMQVYSIGNIPGLTYIWELPNDWTGNSTFDTIEVTVGTISGQVVVYPQNECGIGAPSVLYINTVPVPVMITQPNNALSCQNADTSFSVAVTGSNLVYQWMVNDGGGWVNITSAGADPVYIGWDSPVLILGGVVLANDGYYYRCLISSVDCEVISDSAQLLVDPCTFIGESTGTGYSVGPVPFNNELFVRVPDDGRRIIELNSIDGRVVQRFDLSGSTVYVLGTEGIASGIYLLKLQSKSGVEIIKVIKEFR